MKLAYTAKDVVGSDALYIGRGLKPSSIGNIIACAKEKAFCCDLVLELELADSRSGDVSIRGSLEIYSFPNSSDV